MGDSPFITKILELPLRVFNELWFGDKVMMELILLICYFMVHRARM